VNPAPPKTQSRREFFQACARWGTLAGMGALGGSLLARHGPRPLDGQTCANAGVCRGCPAYAGCGLPQALSARERGMP
jgi:hypothetical protein